MVHYYQPSNSKYNGRIIVQSGRSTALYLKFKHCPNVGGCRALGRDRITNMSRSLYIYNNVDITISISPNNEIWIVSIELPNYDIPYLPFLRYATYTTLRTMLPYQHKTTPYWEFSITMYLLFRTIFSLCRVVISTQTWSNNSRLVWLRNLLPNVVKIISSSMVPQRFVNNPFLP